MKVKIIKEVYSEKQRKFFCASEDPELNKMCDDPMKEQEELEEISAMGGGAVSGPAGVNDEDHLEEMYSTSGAFPPQNQRIEDDSEGEGKKERGIQQGLQNYKTKNENLFHNKWRDFLKG